MKLFEKGELLDEFVPRENTSVKAGLVLYHHPSKAAITEKTNEGFLWMVRNAPRDDEIGGLTELNNLRSNSKEEYELGYLIDGIQEGFITSVKPR